MKLSKSTTILIDVALVVVIAILVKSLIAAPKSASAALQKAAPASKEYAAFISDEDMVAQSLNFRLKEGWTFVFGRPNSRHEIVLIPER